MKNISGKMIIKVFAVISWVVLAILGYFYVKRYGFSLVGIKYFIESLGYWGASVFIIIFVARSIFVFLPCTILVVVAGNIFGPITGLIISLISAFLSSTLSFIISRYMGPEFVTKLLRKKSSYITKKIDLHGMKIVFMMRLSMVVPFDILSYFAGLTRITYSQFIVGTMLGIFPEFLALSYLGDNIDKPFTKGFYLSLLLVLITVLVPMLWQKKKEKNKSGDES